ncbi:biotin--[acetyl-CoA-carboxylase] ligase [Prevotella sp. 10(H)]|uniref:biotin--[acetyl-CoA-carboxylase] ligase n=1 Tax=Prevotella sp. 10(H) TaxID=1158294 RepID=UPI001E41DF9C|nr:biotin--[acetyl-CoA-carboxylase] ligase [Prevotella sp. 10(H)]
MHIKETDSTNNCLKELLLQEKLEEGTVIYADFQTSGKGQRGNGWESERSKNLLFSIVFYPDTIKASEQFIISQFVSLGVAECLQKYTKDISIKWPNDIYWQEKKICGILIENTLLGEYIGQSVVGIGININQEEFVSNAPNPVSLKQITGTDFDLEIILENVRDKIFHYYREVKDRKISDVIDKYKKLLFRRKGYYLYNDGTHDFKARILDVQSDGMLVLETEDGTINKFAFKEVKYILS